MIKNIVVALIVLVPTAYFLIRYFTRPSECGCETCSMRNKCDKASCNSDTKCCCEHNKNDKGAKRIE